jgi:proteasome component ECM29
LFKGLCPNATVVDLHASLEEQIQPLLVETRQHIVQALETRWNDPGIVQYRDWCIHVLDTQNGTQTHAIAAKMLNELVSWGPKDMTVAFLEKRDWLLSFLSAGNAETRTSMAHMYAIVATVSGWESTVPTLHEWMRVAGDAKQPVHRLGALVSIGYLVGHVLYRFHHVPAFWEQVEGESMLRLYHDGLGSTTELVLACCTGLAEIGRYGCLPDTLVSLPVFQDLVKTLQRLVSSKEPKIQERALMTLAHLSLAHPTLSQPVFEFLVGWVHTKTPDLLFTLGESLCCVLFGFRSTTMVEYLDMSGVLVDARCWDPVPVAERTVWLNKIVDLVTPLQSSVARKAGCVWLLCITKYCATMVTDHLMRFHQVFSSLLGDKDEFTQEIASKGVA